MAKKISGGQSRINPITRKGEYVLPSGIVVPATNETYKAITSGKSDLQVLAASKKSSSGSSSSKSSSSTSSSPTTQASISQAEVNLVPQQLIINQAQQAQIQQQIQKEQTLRQIQIAAGQKQTAINYGTPVITKPEITKPQIVNKQSYYKPSNQNDSKNIVNEFLFEEPSLKGISKKGTFEQTLQLTKYTLFEPASAVAKGFIEAGSKIKESSKTGSQVVGISFGALGALLPKTPAEQILVFGGLEIFSKIPKVARIGAGGYFTYKGFKVATNSSFTPEERVAGATIGTLGFAGVTFESVPYIRGIKAKTSLSYKPVVTQPEGFKGVEIKKIDVIKLEGYTGKGKPVSFTEYQTLPFKKPPQQIIGLILEKAPLKTGSTSDVELPFISALKRGGFGVKPNEKKLFISSDQTVATSQSSFFTPGKDIVFNREFFVTPQDPFLKIPETRISRLGIEDPFKFNKQSKLGFGFPKQPEIGIEKGATVSRIEKGGAYRIGLTSELEAIKSYGAITKVSKIGVTVIKGQGVNIYEFKSSSLVSKGPTISIKSPSTFSTNIVSSETTISSAFGTLLKLPVSSLSIPKYTQPIYSSTTISSPTIELPKIIPSKPSPSKPSKSPTYIISPIITPPISPTISPPISPVINPPFVPPTISPPKIYKGSPPIVPPTYTSKNKFRLPKSSSLKLSFNNYNVFGRRFGKFKLVGKARTEKEAFSLGKRFATSTLGVTFKIPGVSGRKLKGFKTKSTKEGILYIEPRGKRLKRRGLSNEVKEIQLYKGLKGGFKTKWE